LKETGKFLKNQKNLEKPEKTGKTLKNWENLKIRRGETGKYACTYVRASIKRAY
jgi:hypothetical protein